MPHSSGGGSRSSGSFSGSSGSSGSWGHGGSRSSGASGKTPTVSDEYQKGYHRYVLYHDNTADYFYSSGPISRKDSRIGLGAVILRLILIALGSLFVWVFISDWIHVPQKLPMDYAQTDLRIEDTAGILSLDDKRLLNESFREFQAVSGVTPAILTVRPEDWQEHYDSFSVFAFEAYVTRFSDESHWLFCYSGDPEADFDDWVWEGMQGDDTDAVLSPRVTERFTDCVQKNLYARNRCSVGEAFSLGIQEILPGLMRTSFQPMAEDAVYVLTYFAILIALPVFLTVSELRKKSPLRGKENAIRCPSDEGDVKEDSCAWCGGLYVHGIHIRCPHCGAPVSPRDED